MKNKKKEEKQGRERTSEHRTPSSNFAFPKNQVIAAAAATEAATEEARRYCCWLLFCHNLMPRIFKQKKVFSVEFEHVNIYVFFVNTCTRMVLLSRFFNVGKGRSYESERSFLASEIDERTKEECVEEEEEEELAQVRKYIVAI